MKLKRPDGAILSNLSVFPASITPKAVVTKLGDKAFAQKPVGSGPFVVDNWERGQYLKMSRNPHYWRPGKPYLDGVEFDYVTNDNTRILSLQSGEVDVAESIPFSQVDSLNKGSTRVEIAPLASIDGIWLNNKHKPFDDKLVRQALNYATDKDAINRVVYFGHAEVADGHLPVLQVHEQVGQELPVRHREGEGAAREVVGAEGLRRHDPDPERGSDEGADDGRREAALGPDRRQRQDPEHGDERAVHEVHERRLRGLRPAASITADVLVPDELALAWLDPNGVQKGFWSFYKSQKAWDLTLAANSTTDEAKRKKLFGQMQRSRSPTRRGCRCSSCPRAPDSARRSRTSTRSRAAGGTSGRSGRAEQRVRGPSTVAAAPRRRRTR